MTYNYLNGSVGNRYVLLLSNIDWSCAVRLAAYKSIYGRGSHSLNNMMANYTNSLRPCKNIHTYDLNVLGIPGQLALADCVDRVTNPGFTSTYSIF